MHHQPLILWVLFFFTSLTPSLWSSSSEVGGVHLGKAPSSWKNISPKSSMRAAQWAIPSSSKEGEVVVFYFGPNQGGDAPSNVQRWERAIKTKEGKPARGQVRQRDVNGMKLTEVVLYGTYASGIPLPGATLVPQPDYGLIGAILEGPQGNLFFRFTGPQELVETTLPAFRQWINISKKIEN